MQSKKQIDDDLGQLSASPLSFSPLKILNAARQAVPAVNYALGAAGLAAAGALITGFLGYGRTGVIVMAGTFITMVLLFVFARLSLAKSPAITLAGEVLLWAVIVFFCAFLGFTVTAFSFQWPSPWAHFVGINEQLELSTNSRSTTPVVPAAPAPTRADLKAEEVFIHSNGSFEKIGLRWVEYNSQRHLMYDYNELKRTSDEVTIYDKTRDTYIELPLNGGLSRAARGTPQVWEALYEVTRQ